MSYGMQMAGSSMTGKPRQKDDFYATKDTDVVRTLITYYKDIIPNIVYEFACGEGHMAREIMSLLPDRQVFSTDLVHRGHGLGGVDFLTLDRNPFGGRAWAGITNPPFKVSAEMVETAMRNGATFVAILAKVQYWNAQSRLGLWRKFPPRANHPLTWRVDFDGRGRPTMDVQWIVFGDVPFSNEPLSR